MDAIIEVIRANPWLVIPCMGISIPIVAIIVGGIHGIVKTIVRHRERMALIEHGVPPDRLPLDDESDAKEKTAAA